MNSDEPMERKTSEEDRRSKGPSLVLIYCLLGTALLAAISIAVLIVLPFYRHR